MAEDFLIKREIRELVIALLNAHVELEQPLEGTQSAELAQYSKGRRKFLFQVEKPLFLDYLKNAILALEEKSTLRPEELEPLLVAAMDKAKEAYVARTTPAQRAADEEKLWAMAKERGDTELLRKMEMVRDGNQPPLLLMLYEGHEDTLGVLGAMFQDLIARRSGPARE